MKAIWIKETVKVNSLKGIVEFNDELSRYYFVATAPQYFDEATETMYSGDSVIIGDTNKESIEQMYNQFKNFFEKHPNKFIKVERNKKVYVDDDNNLD